MNVERVPAFRFDACDHCGICFHECPVLQLPIEESKKEIRRLIQGESSKHILSRCNSCFTCNLICPNQANPYQLILERWNDLYKYRGTPPIYRFVCPTENSNIWQLLNIFLSDREKQWIQDWMNYTPNSQDTVLLIGNYTHLFPFIIGGSKLIDHFKPIDLLDQWEAGAYLYQGGYLDVVQRIAKRIKTDFENLGTKNIAILTDSVEVQVSDIHPNELNVKHDQNFINLNRWLVEKIRDGVIKLNSAPLDYIVTIHDNCYSKVQENKYWDPPRKLLELCGCKIIEMKHHKKDSLCCGFGAGASWTKNISIPFDIISEGIKKFIEAEETGANALVSYCTGCIYLLWATRELLQSKIDIFHVLEIVRLGMGEKLNYPEDHINRAWDIIAIISYSLFLSMFNKNFRIKEFTFDEEMSSFKPRKHILLRIIRLAFNIKIIRKVFSRLFLMMMPLLKSK